jgi:hypothetical protein
VPAPPEPPRRPPRDGRRTTAPGADPFPRLGALTTRLGDIAARQARLAQAQDAAQAELFGQLADDLAHGRITVEDLADMFPAIRAGVAPGWTAAWDALMPGIRGKVQAVTQGRARSFFYEPNGPCGSWRGPYPLTMADPRPRIGVSVVYILYDGPAQQYYGSSYNLLARMRAHRKAGMRFDRWCAYPLATRELAYRVEDRLLKRRRPPHNVKGSRLWRPARTAATGTRP